MVATLNGAQIFIFKEDVVNENGYFNGVCYFGYEIQENQLFKENRRTFSRYATEEEKEKLFKVIKDNGYKWNAETKTLEKLIVPKFKVGDRIKSKIDQVTYKITDIRSDVYIVYVDMDKFGYHIPFSMEKNYELVPKFDINTLKEFDKVLVRGNVGQKWIIDFFGFMDKGYPFVCVAHHISQCIPYEQNKHLLNTTDDCDDYFKTWE